MTIHRGLSGVNREIKQQYRGLSGVNRTIKEQYRGYSGVNRKVFSADFYTDFSDKGYDWTEYGGPFNYGNGLYGADSETAGTMSYSTYNLIGVSTYKMKVLKIPISDVTLTTFTVEYSAYVYSTTNNRIGGILINLCLDDATPLYAFKHSDAWAENTNVSETIYNGNYDSDSSTLKIYDTRGVSSKNGATVVMKIVFNGSIATVYENGTLVATYTLTKSSITINNIKIAAIVYSGYAIPAYRLNYLKVTRS